MRFQKICVMGLGYIGLPTASTFATHGLRVVGVDINPAIIQSLNEGKIHIHEPGLNAVVTQALENGNLTVSMTPEEADAFIISVPTPFYDDKRADLSAVKSAAEAIMPYLREGNLVVLESTSPPKTTTDVVAPILEKSGLKAGEDFLLCYSPERVLPGKIMVELVENARVMGGVNPQSAEAGRDLYLNFVKGAITLTNATTAEMVKLMENTFRDINIAIANEFSRLADQVGIDVWEAITIANMHPRINILQPGPGVGGHCISVDPWFLVETAPDIARLIRTAREVNDSQPHYVLELIQRSLGEPVAGHSISVLGLAYKPDVDDLRESPAVEIATLLSEMGAIVRAYEPYKSGARFPGFSMAQNMKEAVQDSDIIVFLVAHKEFRELTPNALCTLTSARLIVDAVHITSGAEWCEAGFSITTLGVG